MKYKYNNQWKDLNVKVSDTYPIGAIAPYGGFTAPTNWLICDGSAVSRTTYSDLFNVIGTNFGPGDGSTTFNLPDLTEESSNVSNYIIKAFQSAGVVGNVAQTYTESDEDTYPCNYINTLHTYSTSEVVVGTYGGKPLYRKLYETTESLPGSDELASITITHNISNIDKIWVDNSVSRIETTNSPYLSYSLPLIGYNGNTTDKIYAKVDETNITIYGQGWGTTWRKIVGVLYTKTTD